MKNVLFVSIHGYGLDERGCRFYPGGGHQTSKLTTLNIANTSEEDEVYPGGILNLPMLINSTRPQWKDILRSRAFPRINEFKPNIIFISAGFDSHEKDSIANGFGRLIEPDYGWITKELQKLANLHCEGRIISVLEGGYNVKGGLLSPLAQSISFHTAELRSRSYELYEVPTPEELKQLAEMDQKMEEERQKSNEIEEQKYFKRSKRMCLENDAEANNGALLTELIVQEPAAERILNKDEEELEESKVINYLTL